MVSGCEFLNAAQEMNLCTDEKSANMHADEH